MNATPDPKREENAANEEFQRRLAARQRRKLRALRHGDQGVWFGLGMFGVVGWAVAVPTVALTALGVWIDRVTKGPYSWTLMLLIAGVALGCLNAWFWVSKERKDIEKEHENGFEPREGPDEGP